MCGRHTGNFVRDRFTSSVQEVHVFANFEMPFARGHIIVTYSEIFPPVLLDRTKFFKHCKIVESEIFNFSRVSKTFLISIQNWTFDDDPDISTNSLDAQIPYRSLFVFARNTLRGKSVYRGREEFAYRTHTHLSSVFRFKIRGCLESVTSRRIRLRCRFKATVSYMAAS